MDQVHLSPGFKMKANTPETPIASSPPYNPSSGCHPLSDVLMEMDDARFKMFIMALMVESEIREIVSTLVLRCGGYNRIPNT